MRVSPIIRRSIPRAFKDLVLQYAVPRQVHETKLDALERRAKRLEVALDAQRQRVAEQITANTKLRERVATLKDRLAVRLPSDDLASEDTAASVSRSSVLTSDVYENVHEMIMWADQLRYLEELLPTFKLPFVTMLESMSMKVGHVALRHDCDWSIENALAMATLEHKKGIRSTYYLLHPDGFVQTENYFGRVEGNKLHLSPELFENSRRLVDMGHEVAFHNDLISLSLFTKRPPAEFLEQIIGAFDQQGIKIRGSVAHGSKLCPELGYVNYQLFKECEPAKVAEVFRSPFVERDGFRVEKYKINMKDYGLEYEGNFARREVTVSDSGGRWLLVYRNEKTDFAKHQDSEAMMAQLRSYLGRRTPTGAVQCLVHPCHWSALGNYNERIARSIATKRDTDAGEPVDAAKKDVSNVIYAKHNPIFASYDNAYTANAQHFTIATSVKAFTETFVRDNAAKLGRVLEVGCGQGDYLHTIKLLRDEAHAGPEMKAVGVDGSIKAIEACATRYPDCLWAADTVEGFLSAVRSGAVPDHPWLRELDLVVDKTGTTFIKDFEEAAAFFDAVLDLLTPGGGYLYVASRDFYETKLRTNIYKSWPCDWMELAAQKFGRAERFDDELPGLKGYYKRVYWRQ
jgi:SAM-dependent methyltransferase